MKTVLQRWLVVFAAFAVVATIVLAGCTDAVVGHDVAKDAPGPYEASSSMTIHNPSASVKGVGGEPLSSQSHRLQSLEETQRARRLLARW